MTRLSLAQQQMLHSLARSTHRGVPGQKTFISGWPTWGALNKRGLVTIVGDPGSSLRWLVTLTSDGWTRSGVERPAETA